MTDIWHLEDRLPTPAEHRRLAEAVGWHGAFDWASQAASLAGSTLGVVAATPDGTAIAMARVVGDGVKYFYVQDVVVDPDHQGRGVGRAVLARVLARVRALAPAPPFVALFATAEGMSLYRSLGFDAGDMVGMFQVLGD